MQSCLTGFDTFLCWKVYLYKIGHTLMSNYCLLLLLYALEVFIDSRFEAAKVTLGAFSFCFFHCSESINDHFCMQFLTWAHKGCTWPKYDLHLFCIVHTQLLISTWR